MEHHESERLIREAEAYELSLWQEYLSNLRLTDDDIKNKTILDLGAGARGFASYALRHDINPKVYSLDTDFERHSEESTMVRSILTQEQQDVINHHSIRANREQIPVPAESFDLVVAHAAMPGEYYNQDTDVDEAFSEIARVLGPGGEARLFPYVTPTPGDWHEAWMKRIDQKVATLTATGEYTVETLFGSPSADDDELPTGCLRIRRIMKPAQ